MRIFVMAASLRRASHNKKLAAIAAGLAKAKGADVELADFRDFAMPVYDGDIDAATGLPDGARALSARIKAADAIVIATPEYNNSIPGPFKNAIDWLSREKPYPTIGRQILLLGASSGRGAALQGINAARVPLAFVGAHVYPTSLGVGSAASAFSEDGTRLADDGMHSRLAALIAEFLGHAARVAPSRALA